MMRALIVLLLLVPGIVCSAQEGSGVVSASEGAEVVSASEGAGVQLDTLVSALEGRCAAGTEARARYSLEVGTGLVSAYYRLFNPYNINLDQPLVEYGQSVSNVRRHALTLAGTFSRNPSTEIALILGLNWSTYTLRQHPVFGVDPEGKPRYKAYESEPVGKGSGFAVFSFSAELRHIYNPASEFQFYSAIGFGACSYTPLPLLSLTPIALRWTSDHLYGFSPFSLLSASTWLCHLGLGWRF